MEEDTRRSITIDRIYAVCGWRWDKANKETCGICKQAFEIACPGCTHPFMCKLMSNRNCIHVFHVHCIENWLRMNTNCPLCRKTWLLAAS